MEEPFHQILKKWFEDIRNQGLTKHASEIIAEIKDIRKCLVFDKGKNTDAVSGFQGEGIEFTVPDNVKDYLFR